MKFLIAVIFAFVLAAACTKKAMPLISKRKADPPEMIRVEYPPKETVAPDTAAGKVIYTQRCGRCHGLPEIKQFSAGRWDDILPLMIPRAGLNNEEALHVRTYLLAKTTS